MFAASVLQLYCNCILATACLRSGSFSLAAVCRAVLSVLDMLCFLPYGLCIASPAYYTNRQHVTLSVLLSHLPSPYPDHVSLPGLPSSLTPKLEARTNFQHRPKLEHRPQQEACSNIMPHQQ